MRFLKLHAPAILLGILVALFMFYPQWRFERELGEQYHGVYFSYSDSEEYYAVRIAEAYDGQWRLSNPYHAEYKDTPYIQPPLPELLYATVGKVLGVDRAEATLYGSRIIFPFIATLAVYAFAFVFTGSRMRGILYAALIVLGINIILDPKAVIGLFQGKASVTQGLAYARPVSPQIHSIFLFVYLALFWKWLESHRDKFLYISSVVLGLSFYTYFFMWSYILAALGLVYLYSFFRKDFVPRGKLLLSAGIALVIGVPYFYNLWQFVHLPQAPILSFLQGMVMSRRPFFNLTLAIALLFFWLVYPKNDTKKKTWVGILLAAGFIALNQQVVTGRELHAAHYHWYIIAPMAGFAALLAGFYAAERFTSARVVRIGGTLALGLLLWNGYLVQQASYQANFEFYSSEERYGILFDWLNHNTIKGSVVLTYSQRLSDILPVYTHNNVLTSTEAQLLYTPEDRLWFNFFLPVYLQGVAADAALQYFKTHPEYVANMVGGVATRLQNSGCRTCFAEEEYQKMSERYQQFLQEGRFADRYRLDYLVVDRETDQWRIDFLNRFEVVGTVSEFIIYRKTPLGLSFSEP